MSVFSPNDWWLYLAHSWGKSPDQKAKEKEYNHEYYEKNKERILAARKKHGDKDHEGRKIESQDDIKSRMDDEQSELEELMKLNSEAGGYSDEVMENIRQHNQNILDNINALSEKVNSYINDHPDMSAEQKSEMLKNLQDQINKARDQAIDLRKESSHEYLRELGAERSGGSSTSSNKSSNSSSGKSSTKSTAERNKEIQAENAAKLKERQAKRNSESDDTPWWENGDEKYARALEERRKNKR